MGRLEKSGIDYYPMSVDFLGDRKVRKVLRKCGAESIAIIISLLGFVYKDTGYYVHYDDDFAFDIEDQIGGVDGEKVKQVIDACIKFGFFNKAIFDKYRILTSVGIQKRYLNATRRRKGTYAEKAIWLLGNVTETEIVYINSINVYINEDDDDGNGGNDDRGTQSKVKKSKEKESKGEKTRAQEGSIQNEIDDPLLENATEEDFSLGVSFDSKLSSYLEEEDEPENEDWKALQEKAIKVAEGSLPDFVSLSNEGTFQVIQGDKPNWMVVGNAMSKYFESEEPQPSGITGKEEWEFQCNLAKVPPEAIDKITLCGKWAAKQESHILRNWRRHTSKLVSWIGNEYRSQKSRPSTTRSNKKSNNQPTQLSEYESHYAAAAARASAG